MSLWRLILGGALLSVGLFAMLARERIHARRGVQIAQPPLLWLVGGAMVALGGLFWIAAAFTA